MLGCLKNVVYFGQTGGQGAGFFATALLKHST